jgi:drug/metabolite transporter (DMT)-like permease
MCWGFSFPLMKGLLLMQERLLPEASAWFITFETLTVRFALATALIALMCAGRLRSLTRPEIKLGVGLGVFAGVGTVFQMVGLGKTLASTSAFLTQFYVLLLPIFVAVARRKWPSAVLVGFRLGQGEWLTLLAAVFFAGDILWLNKREFVGTDKLRATVVMFATIAVLFAPLSVFTAPPSGGLMAVYRQPGLIAMLAALVVVCTLVAFTLMNVWQPHIPATHAGLVYCAEPVFASLYALFLPEMLARFGQFQYANELLTSSLWVGGGLITLANALVQYDR